MLGRRALQSALLVVLIAYMLDNAQAQKGSKKGVKGGTKGGSKYPPLKPTPVAEPIITKSNFDYLPESEITQKEDKGEISQISVQDVPPQEIPADFVSAGQFCSSWGPHNYRTFDGRLFRYAGHCRHVLFKDCVHEEVFHVILDFSHCSKASNDIERVGAPAKLTEVCKPVALVGAAEESFSIQPGPENSWVVYRLGQAVTVPLVTDSINIQPVGRYLLARATCGAMLWISPEGSMTIQLPEGWRWRTCGICGLKDGNPKDDFQSPSGEHMDDSWAFGNSWMIRDPMEGFEEGCPDAERPTRLPCTQENEANREIAVKASDICLQILSPTFSGCHQAVDPQAYLESCRMSCCEKEGLEGCECSTMSEYFRECKRAHGRIPDDGWRAPELCPMTCSNGTAYSECSPSCAPTCDNPDPACDTSQCLDGCECPRGHVFSGGICIPRSLCPCTFKNKEYPGGHKLHEDCNTCECVSGKWECTKDLCAAACRIVGNGHIVTFDGFWYELPKTCTHHLLYADGHSIQLENVPCRGSVKGRVSSSCGRNIIIKTGDRSPIIKLKKWLEVTANGEEITSLPITISDVHIRMISSLYIQALLPTGVSVTWSADGAAAWISVPPTYFGKTQGLCGTFTRSQADDLLTPEGDTELGPVVFARKWKTEAPCSAAQVDETQTHPCDRNPHLRSEAEEICKVLTHGNDFQECRDLVDIDPYHGACLREICGCQKADRGQCICPLMEHFAAECSLKTGSAMSWRGAVPSCGIQCSGGQEYQLCANPCQYSCAQITNPYDALLQVENTACTSGLSGNTCLDGCSCPQGQSLTSAREGKSVCASVTDCQCIYEGREYSPGFIQERTGKICECTKGKWDCKFLGNINDTGLLGKGYIDTPCPEGTNTESSGCMSDCPVTCLNMHDPPKCHSIICRAGCRCKKGFVLETTSGRCIRPSQCPCHHGGISYQDGQAVQMDCNNCMCKGGQWVCETAECLGKCSLYGAGHYRTFDGKTFDLRFGHCAYVLLKGYTPDGLPFAIISQNVPCLSASYDASAPICRKEVTFTIGSESVTLSKDRLVAVSLTFFVQEIGLFQHIKSSDLGIEILWDGRTRVYVHADPKWKGKLRGLCGDFNGDPTDDFVGPAGGPRQPSALDFADSWRLHSYCPNIAVSYSEVELENSCPEEKQRFARHSCQVLTSHMFEDCHSEVDHAPFLERCVEDACGCEQVGGTCDCLCTAVAAYADACAERGILIAWRSQELCPIQCEECDHYSPCINVCPLDSCQHRLYQGKPDCRGRPCVEGCSPKPCASGLLRNGTAKNNDPCVPEADCEPAWDCVVNGKTFKHGDWVSDATVSDACKTCYCRHGLLDCKDQICVTHPRLFEEILSVTTTPSLEPYTPSPTVYEPPVIPQQRPTSETPPIREFCRVEGWSHWYNTHTPSKEAGGDYEVLDEPNSRLRTHIQLPCSASYMTGIECRPVGPIPKEKQVDNFDCSLPKGLVCENKKGLKGKTVICRDYEIRVNCVCEHVSVQVEIITRTTPTPITTPSPVTICLPENHGWTGWTNGNDPIYNVDGDFETVDTSLAMTVKAGGGGCPRDHVTDIQCRVVKDGRSWKEAQQNEVTCDLHQGLLCIHDDQYNGNKCLDYEVRVFCQCYTTPSVPLTTYPPTELTTVSRCPPGVGWSDCLYQCNQVCLAYQHKLVIEGKCDLIDDPDHCVSGCQYAQCEWPYVQLDESTCVQVADCDCVLEDGTMLAAGQIIQKDCKKCHCQNNKLYCVDVPYCGFGSTAPAHIVEPTTCPPLAKPICNEGFRIFEDNSGVCPQIRCIPECPPGLQWYECHATCERSCLSLKDRKCNHEGCVAGCFCPEGKFRDGQYCRAPDECPDRVCQGFGDPQLVTFDGSLFPFQGKGSFTLANHMENSFSVSGRSDICDGVQTCLVGLTVTFKGHKISVIRGETVVHVDEKAVPIEQTPVEVGYGSIVVMAYPGLNVMIAVPEIKTEVYYFSSQASFAIRVPVGIFFNQTRGLCGNCNFDDDETRPDPDHDGIPSPSIICSFLTDGSFSLCMEDNQHPIPIPSEHEIEDLCPDFENPIFQECGRLVDPGPFRTGCARDVMQGSKPHQAVCKALLEFTRQCCLVTYAPVQAWMEEIHCVVPCPGSSKFVQCHDSCPQTCTNATASSQALCSGIKTDACFCDPGMVFHNGYCISESVCEACDSEGHHPGDIWKEGPCTQCHCEQNLKVVCSTPTCAPAPNCRYDENLVVDSLSDPCCIHYKCELKPRPTCPPPVLPKCLPGEVSKIKATIGACPEYVCECDLSLCPPIHFPSDLELGETVEVAKGDGCCNRANIVCDKEQCPASPACPPGTRVKSYPGSCCIVYKCKPPEDMCVYTSEMGVVEGVEAPVPENLQVPALYQPGERWNDGLCRNCTCIEQNPTLGSGYMPSCMLEQCPDIKESPDNKDYLLEPVPIPGECCPQIARMFCKDSYGNLQEVGSEWKSPDDNCLSFRCELSPLGDVHKVERNIVCATCPEGNEYVPPSTRLGICCGWCRPVSCEEAGRNYFLGATWNSTVRRCYTAECLSTDKGVKAVYHSPKCPTVPKECPKAQIVWDEAGCCEICNTTLVPMSECSPTLVPEIETVGLLAVHDPNKGRCANVKPLKNLKQCAGHCESHSLYSIDDGYFQSNCECCVADAFESFDVSLKCEGRKGAVLKKTFQQPTSCVCSPCSSAAGGNPEVERERFQRLQEKQQKVNSEITQQQLKGGVLFPEAGTDNGRYEQQVDNGHYEQKPDNGHYEQKPDNGHYEQQPDNGHYEQQPDNGHYEQQPDNGHYEQKPDNGRYEQQVDNGHFEQKPDNGRYEQQVDNGHYEQKPDNGRYEQPVDNGRYEQQVDNGRYEQQVDNGHYEQQKTNDLDQDYGLDARAPQDLRRRPKVTGATASQQKPTEFGQSPFAFGELSQPGGSQFPGQQRLTDTNPYPEQASQIRQEIPHYPDTSGSSPYSQPRQGGFPGFPSGNNPYPGQTSQIQQEIPRFPETSGGSPYIQQQETGFGSPINSDHQGQNYQQSSFRSHQTSQFQSGGSGSPGGEYSSSHSQVSGSSGNMDEWQRKMAEHQQQVNDLQNLQKTYTNQAQAQHRQQLEDMAALNRQHNQQAQQVHG